MPAAVSTIVLSATLEPSGRVLLSWNRGAASYRIQQGKAKSGPWRTIAITLATIYSAANPFAWYRVVPLTGEPSDPVRADTPLLFWWDDDALRWRDRSGRFVSEPDLKAALIAFALAAGNEIKDLARQMTVGEITIGQWQQATAFRLKGLYLAKAAAALGGFERMTPADKARAARRTSVQLQYLQRFALAVEAGRLSAGQILARAKLYAAGANGMYETFKRDRWEDLARTGTRTEVKNVLGIADHCLHDPKRPHLPNCPDETARGWVRVGEMSLPGQRVCQANCKCHLSYRIVKVPAAS